MGEGFPSLHEEILELFEEAQTPIASAHPLATLFERAPESRSWGVYKGSHSPVRLAAKFVEIEIEEQRRFEATERSIPCDVCGGPRRWSAGMHWPSYCVSCSRKRENPKRRTRHRVRVSKWNEPIIMTDAA